MTLGAPTPPAGPTAHRWRYRIERRAPGGDWVPLVGMYDPDAVNATFWRLVRAEQGKASPYAFCVLAERVDARDPA